MRVAHVLLVAFLLIGCARDREACGELRMRYVPSVDPLLDVALLFVIDDSSSMAEEQASLAAGLPGLIEALATGDHDGDGTAERDPVPAIHVGVVTTDMGSGGHAQPSCAEPVLGDDGLLAAATSEPAGCDADYPPFLAFTPGEEDLGTSSTDVACVARVGTDGCEFEQPLEAALKALSPVEADRGTAPGYGAPAFFLDTVGHGDGANAGFLGDDTWLAVIPVTDEDDCSARDPDLFDPDAGPYASTDPALRCSMHAEALHPVERYAEGLLQLRRSPGRVVYVPFVGVPTDIVSRPGQAVYWPSLIGDEEERDPRLVPRVDPTRPDRLVPSCEVTGRGAAYPPIRLLELGERLEIGGARVDVRSICDADLGPSLRSLASRLWFSGWPNCIDGGWRRGPDGAVDARLEAVLPEGWSCDEVASAGRALDPVGRPRTQGDREVCVIRQLVPSAEDRAARRAPSGAGWWYDDYIGNDDCVGPPSQLVVPRALPLGTHLEMLRSPSVVPGLSAGDPCDPASALACPPFEPRPGDSTELACDPVTSRCAFTCETDRDCERWALVGAACVSRGEDGPRVCASLACSAE